MNGAGLYFEVATTYVWMGGGIYAPDSSQLHAIREHIVATRAVRADHRGTGDQEAGRAERRHARARAARLAEGPPGRRVPDAQAVPGAREEPAAFAARPDFYKQLVATMKAFAPLIGFLNEPLLEQLRLDKRAHILDT